MILDRSSILGQPGLGYDVKVMNSAAFFGFFLQILECLESNEPNKHQHFKTKLDLGWFQLRSGTNNR